MVKILSCELGIFYSVNTYEFEMPLSQFNLGINLFEIQF